MEGFKQYPISLKCVKSANNELFVEGKSYDAKTFVYQQSFTVVSETGELEYLTFDAGYDFEAVGGLV